MIARDADGEVEVVTFDLDESFTPALLETADRSHMRVEDGSVVITTHQGTWTYQITAIDPLNVTTRLLRYER